MKKNKNAFIALAVGAVMLSSAALANFASSNGYSAYKESVRKAFFLDNYSFKGEMTIDLDGDVLLRNTLSEKYDKANSTLSCKVEEFDASDEPKYQNWSRESYYFDGKSIHSNYGYRDETDPESKYKYVYDDINEYRNRVDPQFSANTLVGGYGDSDEAVKKRFDKFFNFGASCADLVLGDIKNNFVLMSTENGISTYEANLDLFQIPDIANTGMDLVVSQINDNIARRNARMAEDPESSYSPDNFEDSFLKISSNTFINDASCMVSIDENGNLRSNIIKASVCGKDENGDSHTINFKLSLEFSDLGTTVPDMIDVDSPEVLKESDRLRTRLTELERLLEADAFESKEERESYESDYKYTKARLDQFEKNGGKPFTDEDYRAIDAATESEEITVTKHGA